MDDVNRRRAVQLTAAGTAALVAGVVQAQTDDDKECKTYSAARRKVMFRKHLATQLRAHKAMPGADRQVRWTLKKVSGVNGGIDPLNIATVEIEVAQS